MSRTVRGSLGGTPNPGRAEDEDRENGASGGADQASSQRQAVTGGRTKKPKPERKPTFLSFFKVTH